MRKGQYQTNYFEREPQANLSLLQPVAIDLSDGHSARIRPVAPECVMVAPHAN